MVQKAVWLILIISVALFQIRELVPESQAYMDLLAFERKLDQTIMRKRLDIQEALKRPIKVRSLPALSWISFGSFRTILLPQLPSSTLFHCLFHAAKKKTTDIYLQHLQPCQTGCRGWRRNRCLLGAACGGTTS